MEKLLHKSLVISKAIKNDTALFFIEVDFKSKYISIDFSEKDKKANVISLYDMEMCLVFKLESLKTWCRDNRSSVKVEGSVIIFDVMDIMNWNFTKKRLIKIGYWEEPKPMEQIVPNGLKQISVEVRKGVFVDLLLDSKSGKHYTWNWELGRKYKGIEYSKAIEDSELVEFKAIGFT